MTKQPSRGFTIPDLQREPQSVSVPKVKEWLLSADKDEALLRQRLRQLPVSWCHWLVTHTDHFSSRVLDLLIEEHPDKLELRGMRENK